MNYSTYTKEELLEEIRDHEQALKLDEEQFSYAKDCVSKSKVALAEAIIELHKYEQQNNGQSKR